MKKKLWILVALSLALLLSACAPVYKGDARTGNYIAYGADGKTVVYRLTLDEDGRGAIVHYPSFGGETREEIIFEFQGDTLNLHGTEVVGGVIGRNELYGTVSLLDDVYTFELRTDDGVLANFVKE
ncbi:MAG: hypothetical protein E7657_01495 [Ruminococcaceae bacterium]|nr:hypothetical protein [Oscillospiraceae bacterium]